MYKMYKNMFVFGICKVQWCVKYLETNNFTASSVDRWIMLFLHMIVGFLRFDAWGYWVQGVFTYYVIKEKGGGVHWK